MAHMTFNFRLRFAKDILGDIFEPIIGKRQRKPLIRRFKLNLTRCVTFDVIHNTGAILCEFLLNIPFLFQRQKSEILKSHWQC